MLRSQPARRLTGLRPASTAPRLSSGGLFVLLPLSVLAACAPEQGGGAVTDTGAPPAVGVGAAGDPALPAGATGNWLETVQARIAANARSITPQGAGFASALPGHAAIAQFSPEGLILGEADADEPLALRFSSWGAAGAERAVHPVAPALGDCIREVQPDGSCVRQLEYAHEGVTAWWVGLDRGVEFGWTVAAPPAEGDGDGGLTFTMKVEGADWIEAVGEGAELIDAAGETWTVSGPLAWGADGAALPAWLEVDGDSLVVVVDAQGAVYPVTVDPILSAATTTLTVGSSRNGFGYSVSGAGDVNNDGYDDVVVGAPVTASDTGAAYVFHGSASGLSTSASRSLAGSAGGDEFGKSVSGAGDVNGDGYDDIIISAVSSHNGSVLNAGAAFVYLGSASGVVASPTLTLRGNRANGGFGISVAGAGDVNGDGYADVVVGHRATTAGSVSGAVYVHHGSASGLSSSPNRTLLASSGSTEYGTAVDTAGDVNNDGYDDIIIGAFSEPVSGSFVGAAYIHHGSASGIGATANRRLTGFANLSYFGQAVSGAGDVNNDGFDDVIIGAYGDTGTAYVYHGAASGVAASPSRVLSGSGGEWFGKSVSNAGDLDGDSYDDVVVGEPEYTTAGVSVGRVHVYRGSASGVEASASIALTGGGVSQYGWSVSGAGDVNGDGFQDALIGTRDSGSGGTVYVHHGYCYLNCSVDADGDGVVVGGSGPQDCDDTDPSVGAPLTRYRDADGDGLGSAVTAAVCPALAGYASVTGDCDDTDLSVGAPTAGFYIDADNDGLGSADPTVACPDATGVASNDDDCDDDDELVGEATTWYLDWDRDGHGDPSWSLDSCLDLASTGRFFAVGDDCDDTNDGVGGPDVYYADADGDGLGNPAAPSSTCLGAPVGTVSDNSDCDDSNAAVGGPTTWYADADSDTYGDPSDSIADCAQPPGMVARGGDCSDGVAAINPGATETCGDLVDSNCDGVGDQLTDDQDGDGVGGDLEATDGGNDCVADDDSDGVVVEGRGDADYDGVRDYLDSSANTFAVVNNNAEWANARAVTVRYSAPAGTNQMCLSSSSTTSCTFTTISGTTRTFTLPATNTTQTVYARFRASASPSTVTTLSDTIKLDTVKPTNTVASATGLAGAIDLSWTAGVDPVTSSTIASGVAGYKVVYARSATAPSNCATGTVAATLHTSTSLRVSGLVDGSQYSFRICAVDTAGNVSTGATATEWPGADQTGPTGTVVISSDATHSGTTSVSLGLSATDDLGTVSHMCVSNTTTCSSYVTYAATRTHTLVTGSGSKTVNVWFRDNNYNVSGPFSDTIVLDTTAPTDGAASALTATAAATTLSLSWAAATDNSGGAGVASYTVAYRASTTSPTTCAVATGVTRITGVTDLSHELTGLTSGTSYGVRVCSVDAVGNTSAGRTIVRSTAAVFAATAAAGSAAEGSAAEAEGVSSADASADSASVSEASAGCSTSGAAGGAGLQPLLLGALGLRRRRSA